MSENPRVLVVTVHHRDTAITAACLAAIRSQTHAPWRLVVVDHSVGGRDTPALRELLGVTAANEYVLTPTANGGFGAGCNAAVGWAAAWAAAGAAGLRSGHAPTHLWFINPDTQAEPDALAALIARAEAEPALGAVASELGDESAGGLISLPLGRAGPCGARPPTWVSAASVLIRADAFAAASGFDEGYFMYWEDVDLCLRLRRLGWGVAVERASRVGHTRGTSMAPASTLRDYYATRNALRLVRRHAPRWLAVAAVCVLGRVSFAKLFRGEWRRLRASWRGWADGLRGRGGPAPPRPPGPFHQ